MLSGLPAILMRSKAAPNRSEMSSAAEVSVIVSLSTAAEKVGASQDPFTSYQWTVRRFVILCRRIRVPELWPGRQHNRCTTGGHSPVLRADDSRTVWVGVKS